MREIVSSLWIGESLGILERLAITSFLRQGHEFHLYCYGDVSGVPPEAAIKDANEILPASSIFRYEHGEGKGSPAAFSNLFRYKLLLEKGGWWVDTDTVCLKPFHFPGEVVISSELWPGGVKHANTGVMKMPAGHSIARQCYERARSRNPRELRWGETGPILIHSVLEKQGFAHLVENPAVFCPIPPGKWELLLSEDLATCRFYITGATRAIHLWHEMWRRAGRDRDQSFPARCVFSELLTSHGLSPDEPRRREETLPAAPLRAEMPVTVQESRSPEGEKKRRPDISCIVTLHAEGLLAHRTLRSVQRAIDYCAERGVSVEKVFVLDDATDATKEVALRFAPDVSVETTVRDLGLARNEGTRRASGEFVVFQDGDDLISENWFYEAWRRIQEFPYETAVHPEIHFEFGQQYAYWPLAAQDDPRFHVGSLLVHYGWRTEVLLRRSVALEIPYAPLRLEAGFGSEDWHWNTLIIARGIKHEIAPLTAQFYRIREGSLGRSPLSLRSVILKSPFFDDVRFFIFDDMRFFENEKPAPDAATASPERRSDATLAAPPGQKPPLRIRIKSNIKLALYYWGKAFHYSTVRLFVKFDPFGLGKLARAQSYRIRDSLLRPPALPAPPAPPAPAWPPAQTPLLPPEWLTDELRRQSDFEPDLFPDRELLANLRPWQMPALSPMKEVPVYGRIREAAGNEKFSHVFLLPWLLRGGAERESLNFVRALTYDFKKKVLAITTEDKDSPWLYRLPPGVKVIEFGKMARGLDMEQQRVVLLRLLLQLEPEVIHNTNSYLGWLIFSRHGPCFKDTASLYGMVFMDDISEEGKPTGYGRSIMLHQSWPYLKKMISDNRRYPQILCRTYGFEERKFATIYHPAPPLAAATYAPGQKRFRVLWAGRLDRQKRPDLLLGIVRRLRHVDFSVYGLPCLDSPDGVLDALKSCRNVTLHGPYESFELLPVTEFALFLYTSAWDGLPNAILEAMAAGLPVVASSVGGVPEVVNEETGYLIEPPDDVAQFCAAIRRIRENPDEASRKVENAKKLLGERHTWARFVQSVAEIEGYLGEIAPVQPDAAPLEAVSPPQHTARGRRTLAAVLASKRSIIPQ
jgi:glycosyltransferase involved in cell wall biosynthesis